MESNFIILYSLRLVAEFYDADQPPPVHTMNTFTQLIKANDWMGAVSIATQMLKQMNSSMTQGEYQLIQITVYN